MPRIVNVIRAYNTEYKQACTWCIIMLCGISEAESATSAAKYRVKFNDSTLLCLSQKYDETWMVLVNKICRLSPKAKEQHSL